MSVLEFHPENAVGENLAHMERQELIRFVARICLHLKAEQGTRVWRGGIFPENISVDQAGELAIGPAKREKWSGQELEFVAPELYWHGEVSPAADVYSLGLLLYYGLGGGRLPFETATSSGQLARMSGKALPAPKSAGKRLGEVMEKATAFHAADRYQSPEELQIMLESCLDNKYLSTTDGGASVFGKPEEELSEIERMMVEIMESGEDAESEPQPETGTEETETSLEELSPEEQAGLSRPETTPVEKESVSDMVEEFFGSLSGQKDDQQESAPEEKQDPESPAGPEEAEDVRVYEPGHDKKDRLPIPILTEEKNPELEPVVLKQQPRFSRNMTDPAQQQKVVEQVKARRSRRPLIVVLCLCVLLVIGAVVAKPFLTQHVRSSQIAANSGNPTPDPGMFYNEESGVVYEMNEVQPQPSAEAQQPVQTIEQPRYSIIVSDDSWIEAHNACLEQGGHLAVISTREEYDTVTALAEQKGIRYLWIGCHRVDGELVWVTDDPVNYSNWADNEPSYWDDWDGVSEDYVMICLRNGEWVYNDNRNDPAADYPEYYSGSLGYACEFER